MLDTLFQLDTTLVDTDAGKHAQRKGLLLAKKEALKTAQRLSYWGRPLQFGVLFVSFVHIFSELAAIKPEIIGGLELPDWAFHSSAAAFTVAIDLVALYVISAASTSAYIGKQKVGHSRYFFYILTALLNGAFVLSFMPGLPSELTAWLPQVRAVVAVLLALLVPVSLASIETAHRLSEHTRLGLLAETTALDSILSDDDPHKAMERLKAELAEVQAQQAKTEAARSARDRDVDALTKNVSQWQAAYQAELAEHNATKEEITEWEAWREQLREALGGYPDSDLLSLARTMKTRLKAVETAEQTKTRRLAPSMASGEPVATLRSEPRQPGKAVQLCEVCGVNELDATQKGIAGRQKWQQIFDGKYACKECRESAV